MLKKYKQFILGLVLGGLLFVSLPTLAEEIQLYPNRFPIFVDGVEQQVEAYNINDRTYLQLADTSRFLNSKISFNQTDNIIEIDSNKNFNEFSFMNVQAFNYNDDIYLSMKGIIENKNTIMDLLVDWYGKNGNAIVVPDSATNNITDDTIDENKPTSTPDGITEIFKKDDKYYIEYIYINDKISDKNFKINQNNTTNILSLSNQQETFIENIPTINTEDGFNAIEYNYYVDTILPIINNPKYYLAKTTHMGYNVINYRNNVYMLILDISQEYNIHPNFNNSTKTITFNNENTIISIDANNIENAILYHERYYININLLNEFNNN